MSGKRGHGTLLRTLQKGSRGLRSEAESSGKEAGPTSLQLVEGVRAHAHALDGLARRVDAAGLGRAGRADERAERGLVLAGLLEHALARRGGVHACMGGRRGKNAANVGGG